MIENTSADRTLYRDFSLRLLPLSLLIGLAGVGASYWQHGFLIGGSRGIPLAPESVYVPLWHLLLLGFGAGFVMTLVGQATGLISLPYSMSVLGFSTIHVTPTLLLETFLNPLGALLGFRKTGQWNLDFAGLLCSGAILGALIGPFVRVFWLRDPVPFKVIVGFAMAFIAANLFYDLFASHRSTYKPSGGRGPEKKAANAELLPGRVIITVEKNWRHLCIGFQDQQRQMSVPGLLMLGFGIGVVASTLGVGGGFLLVPILATLYRLPVCVIVAGSIPFAMTLSAVGLFSYNIAIPVLTGQNVATEWAWGFFTGSTAVLGSWCGAHLQKYVPEHLLQFFLGIITGGVGVVYVLNYFDVLPFEV